MYATSDFIEKALADPDSMIKTLQVLKETRVERDRALLERDHAIATKAEISRKREATAMATASKYKRENENLKTCLGMSKNWKQARAIPLLKHYFILNRTTCIQIGKALSKMSKQLGYPLKRI